METNSVVSYSLLFSVVSLISLQTAQATTILPEDSVFFDIRIDTIGGVHVGRTFELTYVLVNSQADTVFYPVFGDSIEIVGGPRPHQASCFSIENGVETRSSETGFQYLVRFEQDGETLLPMASVKIGSRTYSTPETRMLVHPPEVDMEALECDLKVEQLVRGIAKYHASLTCNIRPDQTPPLLSINGKTAEPNGKSYSKSEGKEKYVYDYYFDSDGYEVSCNELTFGGKPYYIRPLRNKIDKSDFLIIALIAFVLFEIVQWLVFWSRYRQEKEAPFAAFVLENKFLPLNIDWAYTHYGASHMLLLFSIVSFTMTGVTFYMDNEQISFLFWFGTALLILAYAFYRIQRRKLGFQSIPTVLDKQAIFDKVCQLAEVHHWEIDHYGEDCIVAHTHPPIWHLTWGERIFIVFDKDCIWVNSVNDLNKRTSVCSFGYTKRNIRRIREAVITN